MYEENLEIFEDDISELESDMYKAMGDRDPKTGRYLPGIKNKGAGKYRYGEKGNLSRTNQDFVDSFTFFSKKGLLPWEVLFLMMNDKKTRKDLKFKAAKALQDTYFHNKEIISMKEQKEKSKDDLLNELRSALGADARLLTEKGKEADGDQQGEASSAD